MMTDAQAPSGDASVTARCAACDGPVPAGRARQYCSPACRQDAYRRRHQPARPAVQLPARRSRRDGTVYACGSCESRYLGEQWCHDCRRPCQRQGAGGSCPSCEEVILLEELTGDQVDDTPSKSLPPQANPSTMKKSPRFQGKLRVGGGALACSFCGEVKKAKAGLVAGPGVYICDRCVAKARSQGLVEGTGDSCSFCTRSGRPNWGVGSPGESRPRICDACLGMSEHVLAGDQPG